MFALGINQDLTGGGVALSDGDKLLYAANEERFSRIKNHGGFPHGALAGLFACTGVAPSAVTDICVSGILTPPLALRLLPALQDLLSKEQDTRSTSPVRQVADFLIHHTPISSQRPGGISSRWTRRVLPSVMRRYLPQALHGARIHITEHHPAHAYCAYHLSGFDSALCLTSDGMGDGVSLSISECMGERLERLSWCSPRESLGLFFEALTESFGFVPGRDEGKLTGLAAHGVPTRVREASPFSVAEGRVCYRGPHGLRAVQWISRELMPRYAREDIAAWAQEILETTLIAVVRYWMARTGQRRLVFGGGTAANVKLNQRLMEMPEVEAFFVAPNMGDGGNPVGALAEAGFLSRQRVTDVFLGEDYSESEIEQALKAKGLTANRPDDTAAAIAAQLAEGRTVGRLDGRMEWGPRALGNRSILASATDSGVVERLNEQLKRSDFMPFAPAMLAEEVPRFLLNYEKGLFAGEFMTVCYDCSQEMKDRFPAVVHVDGTARAQIVRADTNPGFHAILSEYRKLTGAGVLLNTSFNIHEEPIVRTPAEAIAAWQTAGLDCLALGPLLIAVALDVTE